MECSYLEISWTLDRFSGCFRNSVKPLRLMASNRIKEHKIHSNGATEYFLIYEEDGVVIEQIATVS